MDGFGHVPVLLEQTIEGLRIKKDGIYLDGTAGGAGHSFRIASELSPKGELICLDKDPEAVEAASERLSSFPNARVIRSDFRDALQTLPEYIGRIDGALLDLGVSSHQLDTAERGFSYSKEGRLDMRMSDSGQTAADIVNTASFEELCRILRDYGEERYAAQIADKIIAVRENEWIDSTTRLSEIVISSLPPAVRRKDKNPSRKTFQALRIAVNDEMNALTEGLEGIFELLAPQGRFCVITFHSIEDRIVKQFFSKKMTGCTCPPEFPVCVCGGTPKAIAVTKKPITADSDELEENRRSRSAKLRIIEKI